jgi:hypothetical protein
MAERLLNVPSYDECLLRPVLLVHPPKTVVVQRHGRWYDGQLRAWHRDADGCQANVCYEVAVGMRYLDWVVSHRTSARECDAREHLPALSAERPSLLVGQVSDTSAGSERLLTASP